MIYTSTRHESSPVSLTEALAIGRASDGGMFLPESVPFIPNAFFNNISEMAPGDIAYVVSEPYFRGKIDAATLKRSIAETFNYPIPLNAISPDIFRFELYNGPTGSFNDTASLFIKVFLDLQRRQTKDKIHFIMSTAGDSGASMATALRGRKDVDLTVVYPLRRISLTQRRRILECAQSSNILAVGVDSPIDNCRYIVNRALNDESLAQEIRMTSANYDNLAKILPQMPLFFVAYSHLRKVDRKRKMVVGLPAGNLGLLVSGIIAKQMGLPISRFVVANNANDVLARYLHDGEYKPRPTIETIAPAIDVSDPDNFERVQALYKGNIDDMRRDMHCYTFSDSEIRKIVDAMPQSTDAVVAATIEATQRDIDPATEVGIVMATAATEAHQPGPMPRTGHHILPRYQLLKQLIIDKFA